MNKALKHVKDLCEKNGWGDDDSCVMEVLNSETPIYKTEISSHRWYDVHFVVVEVDGMKIGFEDYYMTGDACMQDQDLEYDITKVTEVIEEEKTIKVYIPKE